MGDTFYHLRSHGSWVHEKCHPINQNTGKWSPDISMGIAYPGRVWAEVNRWYPWMSLLTYLSNAFCGWHCTGGKQLNGAQFQFNRCNEFVCEMRTIGNRRMQKAKDESNGHVNGTWSGVCIIIVHLECSAEEWMHATWMGQWVSNLFPTE